MQPVVPMKSKDTSSRPVDMTYPRRNSKSMTGASAACIPVMYENAREATLGQGHDWNKYQSNAKRGKQRTMEKTCKLRPVLVILENRRRKLFFKTINMNHLLPIRDRCFCSK